MVIYGLSRSTSSRNFQSLPILDPKILRVDVFPPFRPVSAIYFTVTTTQLLSQLPCTISYKRTKLHLTGYMRVSAASFCKQLKPISIKISVTNNLVKRAIPWNSWYFPIYFTIFTPFEKKCSLFIFFVGLQSHLSILNLGNIVLCPCDRNFP